MNKSEGTLSFLRALFIEIRSTEGPKLLKTDTRPRRERWDRPTGLENGGVCSRKQLQLPTRLMII